VNQEETVADEDSRTKTNDPPNGKIVEPAKRY